MKFSTYITNVILLAILNVFIFSSTANAQNSCKPKANLAPSCPNSGSLLLDDSYPVASAIVSTEQGVGFATAFVSKVMFAQNPPVPIVVSANKAEFEKVVSNITSNPDLTPDQRKKALSLLKRVDPSLGDGENWQQDYFESQFNPKTGMPVLKEAGNYLKIRSMRSNYMDHVTDAISSCGVEKGPKMTVDFDPKYMSGGMSGGNLEALPNGICLVGKDAFETDKHLNSYAKSVCGTDDFLSPPSDFLEVGHTDEFMNVIQDPSKSAPCNYAVTMSSPNKALEVLKQNPDQPLFSNALLDAMNPMDDPSGFNRGICKKVAQKKLYLNWSKNNQNRNSSPEESSRTDGTAKLFFEKMIAKAHAGLSLVNKNAEPDEFTKIMEEADKLKERISKNPGEECKKLTNEDLLKYYEEDDFDNILNRKPSETKLVNATIQKKVDAFKTELLDKTKNHKPSCSPEIVDVPYLFQGKYDKETKTASQALSMFPNSTNGLRLGDKYIFPSPGNEAFGKATAEVYKKKGMKVDYIDTFWAHSQQGNLHCSSHLMRYCNPR